MIMIGLRQPSHRQQWRRALVQRRKSARRPARLLAAAVHQLVVAWNIAVKGGSGMLHYVVVFLLIVLIAAVLGFSGIAGTAAGIAKILLVIFIMLSVLSLLLGRRVRN
jgi:uncharacterized membrane protein YtjA (UPF0391 family)